jgi:hypothetical protein
MAAHGNEAVDRAGAAEDFPARPVQLVAMQLRFRLGVRLPDEPVVVEQLADAERNVHPWMAIVRARLEQ